jgi:hypothetical protein
MPDSSDGEPPGNVVWLGREVQVAIARGLVDWWEELLDDEVPEHLLRILNDPAARRSRN